MEKHEHYLLNKTHEYRRRCYSGFTLPDTETETDTDQLTQNSI